MAMEEKKTLELLSRNFPGAVLETLTSLGDDIAVIQRDALLPVAGYLKSPPHEFTLLLDLTCVDYHGQNPRFEMVYHLCSLSQNKRLRIKTRLDENDLRLASLSGLWKNADWLEREVYDLFGVQFEGHPDLRRIFMWDGFEGHPLRKDYPLRRRQPLIRLRE
jgi:NADH-quinone oxidoreductase subunit C